MIDLCRANCLWATSFFRRCIIPATHCQANRGINAVGLRKLTKYCDSFRFLELFCVYFYWDGTIVHEFYGTIYANKENGKLESNKRMWLYEKIHISILGNRVSVTYSKEV